jgi:hypothetical protein
MTKTDAETSLRNEQGREYFFALVARKFEKGKSRSLKLI